MPSVKCRLPFDYKGDSWLNTQHCRSHFGLVMATTFCWKEKCCPLRTCSYHSQPSKFCSQIPWNVGCRFDCQMLYFLYSIMVSLQRPNLVFRAGCHRTKLTSARAVDDKSRRKSVRDDQVPTTLLHSTNIQDCELRTC